jgi:RecB family exonuclease
MTTAPYIRKPLKISHSEMKCFVRCPRQWWLRYYRELGLRPEDEDPTGVRNLGARIHAALQALYERGADPIMAIDEIYASDIKALIDHGMEDKITKLQEEQDLAHAMLEGYLEWIVEKAIDAEYKVVASEQAIEVESGFLGVQMRGVLDEQVERNSDGAILFRDFKTVGSFTEQRAILPMNPQMRFYHLLLQLHTAYLARTTGEQMRRVDGAIYTMLRRVKRSNRAQPPFYDQVEVPSNPKIIETTWIKVHGILERMIKTHDALDRGADHQYVAPPNVTRDCTWDCEFLSVCPMFDDGSNVEGYLAAYYIHRDPNARYHRDDQKARME